MCGFMACVVRCFALLRACKCMVWCLFGVVCYFLIYAWARILVLRGNLSFMREQRSKVWLHWGEPSNWDLMSCLTIKEHLSLIHI